MKYRVEVAGRMFDVEAISPRHVRIDGEDLYLDVVAGHVLHEGRSLRFHVQRDARGFPRSILIEGCEIPLSLEDPTRARRAASGRGRGGAGGFEGQVGAPMNGQVVNVLRGEGDPVEKGDVVLVLEAMKMENEVTAPVRGRVHGLLVAKGATVKSGDPLFSIDTSSSAEEAAPAAAAPGEH